MAQNCLKKLTIMHDEVERKIERYKLAQRQQFLRKFNNLIENWKGQLPNLREIFTKEEIDWLLAESMRTDDRNINPEAIIDFVIRTGYKDEPELDEDGRPLVRRTTPLHHAATMRQHCVLELFRIYDRYDVNYADADGYTHFHVACHFGYEDIVEKFLDAGQDPECLEQRWSSINPPLYLAVRHERAKVFELLLRRGADPNVANEDGSTPLHVMCSTSCYDEKGWTTFFFDICDYVQWTVLVDARDKLGRTPLHLVLSRSWWECETLVELLLRRGADPKRWTPLHLMIHKNTYFSLNVGLLERFFEVNREIDQLVQVDARDELGRTPLQWAVAKLLPESGRCTLCGV